MIGEIQEANARLNRVVGNLLGVARLESGQVRPRLDWHDARDLVQTTLRELQRELAAHPVKLDLPAAPLLVRLDFSLAQHALANLLLDAANHTPANTPIEVSAQLANDQLVFSVADRGRGIPPEWLPRIFDKFLRPHRAHRRQRTWPHHCQGFRRSSRRNHHRHQPSGWRAMFTLNFPQPEKPPE